LIRSCSSKAIGCNGSVIADMAIASSCSSGFPVSASVVVKGITFEINSSSIFEHKNAI